MADRVGAQFTPGPWTLTPEVGGENFLHSVYGPDEGGDGGLLIARCDQNGEHSEDASLIAAAPDMLEALEAVVPALEEEISSLTANYTNHSGPGKGKVTDPDGIAWINQFQEPLTKIKAAIAKARGDQ